jgi:pimeloyl-ACP methyl ester carboxylesterase
MAKSTRASVAGITRGFQERQVALDDVTLNYVAGPQRDLPLLLIPGQMESWQGYKRVMPALAERFHVFVPDLRGHGKSTRTPGQYSYNICGADLQRFIETVIQRPTLVAGLSSGGVLAIWLAAYAPQDVLAIIAEDPPIFSSIWPRIQEEKFMARSFQVAVQVLGQPGERDVERYLYEVGRINRAVRPHRPYDVPLLPFNMRAGFKFLSEYDTDFSRATLDGDLSKSFSPEEALQRVRCPMLLLRARASRHETWGLLGAIDDDDLARIVSLVGDLQVVQIPTGHEIHMLQPQRYIDELLGFVAQLRDQHKVTYS